MAFKRNIKSGNNDEKYCMSDRFPCIEGVRSKGIIKVISKKQLNEKSI